MQCPVGAETGSVPLISQTTPAATGRSLGQKLIDKVGGRRSGSGTGKRYGIPLDYVLGASGQPADFAHSEGQLLNRLYVSRGRNRPVPRRERDNARCPSAA